MLISSNRSVSFWFRRGDPVPTAVSMLSQSPNVIQGTSRLFLGVVLVFFGLLSTAKHDHHALSRAFLANCGTMVNSGGRTNFALKFIFLPLEWAFVDIEKPNIIFSSIARISTEHNQVGFIKDHSVAISLPRGHAFVCDLDNFPSWSELTKRYYFLRSKMYS